MDPLETLTLALVPGINPGKWLDRWRDRRPDIPLAVDAVDEPDQVSALQDHAVVFMRTGPDGSPAGLTEAELRARPALLTIPLYEELPVAVVPRDHLVTLATEAPVSAFRADELLDVARLGYRDAVDLAGNNAGVAVVPQAVARALGRRDTVVMPLTGSDPQEFGLERVRPEDGGLPTALADRLLHPTRIWLCFARSWQDPDTGENHPVIEEFVGIVRGRTAESSRQPSVRERQQSEAGERLRTRQSASAGGNSRSGESTKSGASAARSGRHRGRGGRPSSTGRGRR